MPTRTVSDEERELYRQVCFARSRSRWIASLGFEPFDWQKHVLDSKAKRKSILGTRQAGKSTIVSGIPCHTAKYYPKTLSIILAPTQGQAKDDMAKVKDFISMDSTYPEMVKCSEDRIELSNGSVIQVVTATDTSARGKSKPRVIVLDEASRIDDLVYTSAVRPMITGNPECELVLISTPNGKQGFFFNSICGSNRRWERYRILSPWNVTQDGMDLERMPMTDEEFMADAKANGFVGGWYSPRHFSYEEQVDNLLEMGRMQYRQEYGCEFVETEDMVYSYSDIDAFLGSVDAEPFDGARQEAEMIEFPVVAE